MKVVERDAGLSWKKRGMRDQDTPFQILRLQGDYLNRDTFMEFNKLRAASLFLQICKGSACARER